MTYIEFRYLCTKTMIKWGLNSNQFVELPAMLEDHESVRCT